MGGLRKIDSESDPKIKTPNPSPDSRDGHGYEAGRIRSPATFFGTGFKFLEKNGFGMVWCRPIVYRMYVKTWQR